MRFSCMLENYCIIKPFVWHKKRYIWFKVLFEIQNSWKVRKVFKHTAKFKYSLRWHDGAPALVVEK